VGRLAAPEARARAVARATFLGYFGYFIGPPSFGFLAGAFGLRVTLGLAAGLLGLVLILAPLMARQGRLSGRNASG
jgi:MFS family permease